MSYTPYNPTALWSPPIAPHALDDEFDGSALDASWAWTVAPSATAIDPYAAVTTGGPRISHNDRRPSWLMVQSAGNATTISLHRAYTLPTNVLMWGRMAFNHRNVTSPVNNDSSMGFGFTASTGALPDFADNALLYINEADPGKTQCSAGVSEGSASQLDVTTTDVWNTTSTGQPLEYFAIHKVGSTLFFWVATANGSWVYMGTRVYAGATLDRVVVNFTNVTPSTLPGTMYCGIDFIRFVESPTHLP